MGGQRHAPAALSPGNRFGTHRKGVLVGPKVGPYRYGKISPPPPTGLDHRNVQRVASRYTDWATPAHERRGLIN